MKEYDVVVAGGGPAGSVAALTLARAGRRVLMAHADRPGEFRVGEGLPPQTRKLLTDLGLWEQTLADGHRKSHGTLSAWGDAELRANDFVFNLDGDGLQLDRARFDHTLRRCAGDAGAEIRQGARVHIAEDDAGTNGWRHLHLATGEGVQPIRCRWLINATGRSASLARKLGATPARADALVAIHLRLSPAEPGHDEQGSTLVESVEEGWWYTVLLPSGERLVVFFGDGDTIDRRTLLTSEGFLERMRNETRHVSERAAYHPKAAGVPHGASACGSRLDQMTGQGWIAVGDAALAFDPLSSKGISNALYTGLCGASTILATEAGDDQACARFQQHLEDIFTSYQTHLRHYYANESRWPDSPFWQRRAQVRQTP